MDIYYVYLYMYIYHCTEGTRKVSISRAYIYIYNIILQNDETALFRLIIIETSPSSSPYIQEEEEAATMAAER